MVLSIVSALFALVLIVFTVLITLRWMPIIAVIQIFIGLLQGVVAITTAAFSCRAVCCGRKQHPGAVIFTSKEESVEQMGKRGALSYNQDADKVNGSVLNTVEPFDNNDFNGEGPTKLVNINFNNAATSYLYQ